MSDQIEIKVIKDLQKKDVIVLIISSVIQKAFVENPEFFEELVQKVKEIFPNNFIIFLPKGMRLSRLSEDEMNSLGWYKKENEIEKQQIYLH